MEEIAAAATIHKFGSHLTDDGRTAKYLRQQ